MVVAIPLVFQFLLLGALGILDRIARDETHDQIRANVINVSAYRLMTLLTEAQTGIRGYVITRERTFAEPYTRALNQVPQAVEFAIRLPLAGDPAPGSPPQS